MTYAIHWKLWFKPRHVSIHVSQKICAEFSQVSSGPRKSSSVGMGTSPRRSSKRQGTVVETCGLLQRLSSWFCTVSILAFLQHLSSCWIWFSELLLQAYFSYKKKAFYGKNYELLARMFWPSVNFNVDELLPVSQLSSIAVKWWNEKQLAAFVFDLREHGGNETGFGENSWMSGTTKKIQEQARPLIPVRLLHEKF